MRIELTPAAVPRAPSGSPSVPAPAFPTPPTSPTTPQDRVSLSAAVQPPLPDLAAAASAALRSIASTLPNIAPASAGTGASPPAPAASLPAAAPPIPTLSGTHYATAATMEPVAAGTLQSTATATMPTAAPALATKPSANYTTAATTESVAVSSPAAVARLLAAGIPTSPTPPAPPATTTTTVARTAVATENFTAQNPAAAQAALQPDTGGPQSKLSQPAAPVQAVQAAVVKNIDSAPARVVNALLTALGGDGAALLEKLALTIHDAATPATRVNDSPVYAAPLKSDLGGGNTLLTSLLMQGTALSTDQQSLSYRAALTLDRQALKSLAPALAALVADSDALKNLTLKISSSAPELAGQQFSYTLAIDPRALWPAQMFIISGWIALQWPLAVQRKAGDEAQDNKGEDGENPTPRKAKKPQPEAPAEPEIDDGGPPVISGQRWLSFKLHHLYERLCDWLQ